MEPRLILVVPAGARGEDVAPALRAAGDVAAVVLSREAAGLSDLIATVQSAGAAALVTQGSGAGWPVPAGADGLHADGPDDGQRTAVARRPEGAMVGAVARSRHEAMVLGESGADYVWFGGSGPDHAAAELAAWWSALFEVPAVVAGPVEWLSTMMDTGAEFVAVTDLFAGGGEAALRRAAEVAATLRAGRAVVS